MSTVKGIIIEDVGYYITSFSCLYENYSRPLAMLVWQRFLSWERQSNTYRSQGTSHFKISPNILFRKEYHNLY